MNFISNYISNRTLRAHIMEYIRDRGPHAAYTIIVNSRQPLANRYLRNFNHLMNIARQPLQG